MGVLDLIFPKTCLECKKTGKYICDDCLRKVPPGGWVTKSNLSLFRYKGVIRKAIIALKYKYSTEVADELVSYLVTSLLRNKFIMPGTCLIPVPMHWYKKNFRGFNQAELIGEKLSKKMSWKFIPDLLIKKKPTTSQVELKGSARRKNLYGVFSLNPDYTLNAKPYTLVLFDDVLTTGSTLKEAMEVLHAAGVKKVFGLTVAR